MLSLMDLIVILGINKLNNLDFQKIDYKRFPVVKVLNLLPQNHSLFETVIVSANDKLVDLFLNKKIKFLDISRVLFKVLNTKEFKKYKLITPTNIAHIERLSKYVSLKIDSLCV